MSFISHSQAVSSQLQFSRDRTSTLCSAFYGTLVMPKRVVPYKVNNRTPTAEDDDVPYENTKRRRGIDQDDWIDVGNEVANEPHLSASMPDVTQIQVQSAKVQSRRQTDFQPVATHGSSMAIQQMMSDTRLQHPDIARLHLLIDPQIPTTRPYSLSESVFKLLFDHDSNTLLRFLDTRGHQSFTLVFARQIESCKMKIEIKRTGGEFSVLTSIQTKEQELECRLTDDGQILKDLLPRTVTDAGILKGRTCNSCFSYKWEVHIQGLIDSNGQVTLESCLESHMHPWDLVMKSAKVTRMEGDVATKAEMAARFIFLVAQEHCYRSKQKERERFVVTK